MPRIVIQRDFGTVYDYAGQADHSKDYRNPKGKLAKTMHFSVMYHFANLKVERNIKSSVSIVTIVRCLGRTLASHEKPFLSFLSLQIMHC